MKRETAGQHILNCVEVTAWLQGSTPFCVLAHWEVQGPVCREHEREQLQRSHGDSRNGVLRLTVRSRCVASSPTTSRMSGGPEASVLLKLGEAELEVKHRTEGRGERQPGDAMMPLWCKFFFWAMCPTTNESRLKTAMSTKCSGRGRGVGDSARNVPSPSPSPLVHTAHLSAVIMYTPLALAQDSSATNNIHVNTNIY